MNEQDARDFISKVFRFEKIVDFKLKKYPKSNSLYYDVTFDGKTKIELYETSATWFKFACRDEDMASYSSLWREFTLSRKLKRGEVNAEIIKKYVKAVEDDMDLAVEAEIDDRLTEEFSEVFGVYHEEILSMDKAYFDYIREMADTEEKIKVVHEEILRTTNMQLTKVKKLLDNYLIEKVPVTVNEQGESVYNFDMDSENVYEELKTTLNDLDETRRYHIYLNDQKEEIIKREKQENLKD